MLNCSISVLSVNPASILTIDLSMNSFFGNYSGMSMLPTLSSVTRNASITLRVNQPLNQKGAFAPLLYKGSIFNASLKLTYTGSAWVLKLFTILLNAFSIKVLLPQPRGPISNFAPPPINFLRMDSSLGCSMVNSINFSVSIYSACSIKLTSNGSSSSDSVVEFFVAILVSSLLGYNN